MTKRIAIVLGRGLEGCGVSQCARQMQLATGADIFYANDKKWPREKGMDFPTTGFSMEKEWHLYAEKINKEYDLCVVYSIPSATHPDRCQSGFLFFLAALNIRKAFINVDHKQASISRNANLKQVCEKVDVIMTHSLDNPFCKTVGKLGIKTPVVKMGLGFDYDGHRAKYWKPIEEQQSNVVRWIGRTTGWKGPDLMIDFHEKELMDSGFITILEGLEASIGYTSILYRDKGLTDRRKVMNYFRPEKEHGELTKFTPGLYGKEVTGVGAYLYNPYINTDAMHRMSKSGFGSDLYHLAAEMYGNNIENCHAEIIACGAVPIFHRHFCDNIIHKRQGDPVSKCKNTGTIGLDYSNFEQARETIVKLQADTGLRNEWREMAFEFWKEHSDAKETIGEIIELAFSNTSQLESEPTLEDFF